METHSSILAWEMPWTEDPGRLQSMGSQESRHALATELQQQQPLYKEVVFSLGAILPAPPSLQPRLN